MLSDFDHLKLHLNRINSTFKNKSFEYSHAVKCHDLYNFLQKTPLEHLQIYKLLRKQE